MAAPSSDTPSRRRSDQQALKDARAQGRKDAELDQFRAATRKHLATVNGSIQRTAEGLESLGAEFRVFKNQQATRDQVATALAQALGKQGKRRLSTLQGVFMAIMCAAAVAAVILPYVH